MSNRLARSTLKTAAILGARVATQAFSLILLTRLFGAQNYGPLISAATLATVLGILATLGSGYVMLVTAPQRPGAVAHVWRYAYPLTLALGAALLVVYIPSAILIGGEHALPLHILLWIAVTELLLTPCIALLSSALQAHERVPLSQVLQWFPMVLRALAILPCYLLSDDNRLVGYVVLQLAATALGLGIAAVITHRTIQLDWRPRLITADELRMGASYSAMHMVLSNSSEFDKILAIRFLSSHETGVYAATTRVISALVMPVVAVLLSAQPRLFSYAHAPTKQGLRLMQLLGLLTAGWGVTSALILLGIAPFLPMLFGETFNEMAQLMPLLAFVALPLALRYTAGTILGALGKPVERIAFELLGTAALFVLMLVLTPAFGIRGLAIAVIISELNMAICGWLLVYRRVRSLAQRLNSGS
jgi:O-antigen/teichoic acid export membrane protein